jgi:prepilin-type processing-associated H-X9-DG protein
MRAKQLTKIDVAAALMAVFLLGNLAVVGTGGRERAKRAVCLSGLERLAHAWSLFAEDHDGRIVSGNVLILGLPPSAAREVVPWVGKSYANDYMTGVLPNDAQEEGIRAGALWPYVQEIRLYHCPQGDVGQVLSYAIVDAMNGMPRSGTAEGGFDPEAKGIRVGDTMLWIRNLAEILTPGPAERMVFIDEGRPMPASFSIHYAYEKWWDQPPVRHGDGTSVSFADGHCEYWRWSSERIITAGPDRGLVPFVPEPQTPQEKEDLHRFQIAVWGRLGYEPSR